MTHQIIQSLEKTIEGSTGTEILEAIRNAGYEIDSPCGGKGTCGKCAVRIVSGKVDPGDTGSLSQDQIANGFVLSCKAKINESPVTLEIPGQSRKDGGQFIDETDETCFVHVDFINKKCILHPITRKIVLDVPGPQLQDGLSDIDRLTRALGHIDGIGEIFVPLAIIRETAPVLRAQNGRITITIAKTLSHYQIIAIESGDQTQHHYGIAIDIGTTTVALQLVDLNTAQLLATRTAYNDQVECGLDVISRINYAKKPQRLEELRSRVLKTINTLVDRVCEISEIKPVDICNAALAGNTTMIHLLLGLNPEYIRMEPYTPTVLEHLHLNAYEIGININSQSLVYISPGVGSYVGGDITAGILCTPIGTPKDEIDLFIDIGTNGELVIGNHEFLLACACSAGPAFEGGGIENGMRAANGAIEKVEVDGKTGMATYQTIGNKKPVGICGSGMISLLAQLFLTGWMDAAGKLNRDRVSTAIEIQGRQARYIIVPKEESATGKPIFISESDIENVIRAKAAIYSACALMLEQVGMGFENLTHIYIAGGFGRFLDIEKAIILGLLPDVPREKFRYIGNASLMGTYLTLVSNEYKQRQLEIAKRMTYMELSTDPAYMDQYTGALFIPHTDMDHFPTFLKKGEVSNSL